MISNKDAVTKANECALELLGAQDVSLEEIELEEQEGKKLWSITLGFPQRLNEVKNIFGAGILSDPIQLKRFLIDAETGEFVAMRLRELAAR